MCVSATSDQAGQPSGDDGIYAAIVKYIAHLGRRAKRKLLLLYHEKFRKPSLDNDKKASQEGANHEASTEGGRKKKRRKRRHKHKDTEKSNCIIAQNSISIPPYASPEASVGQESPRVRPSSLVLKTSVQTDKNAQLKSQHSHTSNKSTSSKSVADNASVSLSFKTADATTFSPPAKVTLVGVPPESESESSGESYTGDESDDEESDGGAFDGPPKSDKAKVILDVFCVT